MALNPNFTSQGDRPLPVVFGYALASGDTALQITDTGNGQTAYILLSDGECDGIEQFALTASDMLYSSSLAYFEVNSNLLSLQHIGKKLQFHAGTWTPIGLANLPQSTGPDQGFDSLFTIIPTVTPPQSFSNISYVAVYLPNTTSILDRINLTAPGPLEFFAIFRGSRCRYFDENGNVTGYGFTTNPTWHIIEVLLRYKFKRQQPQIAGLLAQEIACFNWPSIVAHAAYNDGILANGLKRFTGNYVFASTGTLSAMLETMLRCCQSYIDDQDGKIGLFHFQPVNSSFALSGRHVVPGSFQVQKADITRAPNVFIPAFRDMNIAAILRVNSVQVNNNGNTDGYNTVQQGLWEAYFDAGGNNPFVQNNILYYGDGSNPALNGDYVVSMNPAPVANVPLPQIWCWANSVLSAQGAQSSNGGYIGTQSSRFGKRSPTTVQHRRHQTANGQIAPGLGSLPTIRPVQYDLGNMSYDQANRLMHYMCNSTLGNDVPGWSAPLTGTMKVYLDAVDHNGNAFARMRPNQRFTVDSLVSPEFAGDFLIGDGTGAALTINPPSKSSPMGSIDVPFRTYNPNAFTDVSDIPDDSLRTIASAALPYAYSSIQMTNVCWVLNSNPVQTLASDGTVTVTIGELWVQILGESSQRKLSDISTAPATWTEIPVGKPYILFVTLQTFPIVLGPNYGGVPGPPPPGWAGWPSDQYPILVGTFDGVSAIGTGGGGGGFGSGAGGGPAPVQPGTVVS